MLAAYTRIRGQETRVDGGDYSRAKKQYSRERKLPSRTQSGSLRREICKRVIQGVDASNRATQRDEEERHRRALSTVKNKRHAHTQETTRREERPLRRKTVLHAFSSCMHAHKLLRRRCTPPQARGNAALRYPGPFFPRPRCYGIRLRGTMTSTIVRRHCVVRGGGGGARGR